MGRNKKNFPVHKGIFKRTVSFVTSVLTAVTLITSSGGIAQVSAAEPTYTVDSSIGNLVNIMNSYGFIAFDTLNTSGHQHSNAIADKATVASLGGELNIRGSFENNATTTYIRELADLPTGYNIKIGKTNDTLVVGKDNAVSGTIQKYINGHKVESAGTVYAETDTQRYINLAELKKSFISYNKQLAAASASGSGITKIGNSRLEVSAASGTVYYSINAGSISSFSSKPVINFSSSSTASLVLNIDMNGMPLDMNGIAWNRDPFILNIDNAQPTQGEDVWGTKLNRIYYNFYDSSKTDLQYTGSIFMADKGWGTIIAPSASTNLGSNFCGTTISTNIAAIGQSHRVNPTNPVIPIEPTYNAEFTKTDGTSALENAGFTLYSKADCGDADKIGTEVKSDPTGKVTFTNLKAGTYYFKETSVPSGYEENATVYTLTVADTGNTITASGTTLSGSSAAGYVIANTEVAVSDIRLIKTVDGNASADAATSEFTLYSSSACTPATKISSASPVFDGTSYIVSFAGSTLATGNTYYLRETTPATGCTVNNSIYECRVNANGKVQYRVYTVGNTNPFGSEDVFPTCNNVSIPPVTVSDIRLIKTVDGNASADAATSEFTLYSSSACTPATKISSASPVFDGTSYIVSFAGSTLATGNTYYLRETTPATGCTVNNSIYECRVNTNGKVQYRVYTVGNTNPFGSEDVFPTCNNVSIPPVTVTVGPLTIYKTDGLNPLPGATFSVYNAYPCSSSSLIGTKTVTDTGSGSAVMFYQNDTVPPLMVNNTYYVMETAAPQRIFGKHGNLCLQGSRRRHRFV